MKKILSPIFVSLLASSAYGEAQVKPEPSAAEILRDYDGGDEKDRALALTAIGREADGFGWINTYLRVSRKTTPAFCQPPDLLITPEVAIGILRRKLAERPNLGPQPFGAVLLIALQQAFPCSP